MAPNWQCLFTHWYMYATLSPNNNNNKNKINKLWQATIGWYDPVCALTVTALIVLLSEHQNPRTKKSVPNCMCIYGSDDLWQNNKQFIIFVQVPVHWLTRGGQVWAIIGRQGPRDSAAGIRAARPPQIRTPYSWDISLSYSFSFLNWLRFRFVFDIVKKLLLQYFVQFTAIVLSWHVPESVVI